MLRKMTFISTMLLTYLGEASIDLSQLPGASTHNTGPGEIQKILSIVFGLVGVLSLLFITISGFRYIVSGGDPQSTAKAKEGIIYSVVGLVIAIFAEVIVAFVVGRIG